MSDKKELNGLALLRKPFETHQISKLPKPTAAQTKEVKDDFSKGIRCKECGGWHHPKVVHLDYVGHAALTDRLLDCDPSWNWEPASVNPDGSPKLDSNNGLWIKLTVCGVTRLGYGHPDGKTGGDSIKETIGDALRNAAMRFGAALDLWHKGDLHAEETTNASPQKQVSKAQQIDALKARDVKPEEVGKHLDEVRKVQGSLEDPGQFVFPVGKFLGQKLCDMNLEDVIKNMDYWTDKKKKGSVPPAITDFLNNGYDYLVVKGVYPKPYQGD